MDVTDATREDIVSVIPQVSKLRRDLIVRNPVLRRGAPRTKDDAKAVKAARLYNEGKSYVEVGRIFRWRVYTYDIASGSFPTAEVK